MTDQEKLQKAAIKIAAGSVYLNCAVNCGLEAAELANSCMPSLEKKSLLEFSQMITRVRHDSKLLEKKMKIGEEGMDFLYDTFFKISDLADYLVILTDEEIDSVKNLLIEMTKDKVKIIK